MSARDANLVFLAPNTTPKTASGIIGAAVQCEGGFFALARLKFGVIGAGTTPTYDITIEASLDAGTTYYKIGQFPRVVNTEDEMEIARPVWVPRPDPAKTTVALGKGVVYVRLYGTVGGTVSCIVSWAVLEPLVDLAGPAADLGPTGTIGVFTNTTRRGVEELGVITGA